MVRGLLIAAAGALGVSACTTTTSFTPPPGGKTVSWREVTRVENRFAVFINEPGEPKEGDLVTFRLAYVYAPGEVRYEDKVVGWQEYASMTINCMTGQMRPGPRVRYAPDGKVMFSDDVEEFTDIVSATAAEDAALVRCGGSLSAAVFRLPDGPKWMDGARKHLAEPPPPQVQ